MVGLILLVFAFVLALIEALWPTWTARARPHLGWLAVALWILFQLLGTAGGIR
jgi:hypothetical protein